MSALLTALLAVPAFIVFVIAAFFALEVIGAFLPPRKPPSAAPGAIAVVVPAHNEGAGLVPTIRDIREQMRPQDRLIVVADNCDDDTAGEAMRAGASVLIRNDPARRGKGYALQFALDALKEAPPALVVFIDADCRLGEGSLQRLAGAAAGAGRPAQALYLMRAGENAPASRRVAEFAWLLINRVRMGGLYTLFDLCRLAGSGMALPWTIAERLDIASGEIVEDLALGLTLTEAGDAPVLCADALVTSEFAQGEDGAVSQRARWEHGSLRLAARRAPALFLRAMSMRDLRLAAAAFDLAIPPMVALGVLSFAVFIASALGLALGAAAAPFSLSVWALFLLAAATLAAWARFGMQALPPSALGALAEYALQKAKIYGEKARASTREWTRTDRGGKGGRS